MAVIDTCAGVVPNPYTEHLTIDAVLASVAGIKVTPWLQKPYGPAVTFGAVVPASNATPPTVIAGPFRLIAR